MTASRAGFDEVACALRQPRRVRTRRAMSTPGRAASQGTILSDKLQQLKPDPNISTPLYLQLASKLTVAVHGGVWQPNEALPAERILSETLEISRFTARKAIEILCERAVYDAG